MGSASTSYFQFEASATRSTPPFSIIIIKTTDLRAVQFCKSVFKRLLLLKVLNAGDVVRYFRYPIISY